MSKKKSQFRGPDQEIDRLLMETLQEEMPAGLEERLDSHWEAFQNQAAAEGKPNLDAARNKKENVLRWFLPVSRRLLPKAALAAAAVGMVIWGISLQAEGSSNVLAKNLNLIKTTVLVKDQVSLSQSLTCRVELSTEQNRNRVYLVRWLPPNLQRVDMWDREGNRIRTVWVSGQDITVADRRVENIYSVEEIGQIDDPYLPAILRLNQPQELADCLYGEWEEKERELREGCVWSTYRIASLEESRATFDMTVDLCDYRPVEIRRDLGSAKTPQAGGRTTLYFRFDWDTSIPMEHMVPEKKTAPREV
jgi:hypothetical protein